MNNGNLFTNGNVNTGGMMGQPMVSNSVNRAEGSKIAVKVTPEQVKALLGSSTVNVQNLMDMNFGGNFWNQNSNTNWNPSSFNLNNNSLNLGTTTASNTVTTSQPNANPRPVVVMSNNQQNTSQISGNPFAGNSNISIGGGVIQNNGGTMHNSQTVVEGNTDVHVDPKLQKYLEE